MTDLEQAIRAEFHREADTATEVSRAQSAALRLAIPDTSSPRRFRQWLLPIGAAAAVLALVAGLALSNHLGGFRGSQRNPATHPPATPPPSANVVLPESLVVHDGQTVRATGKLILDASNRYELCDMSGTDWGPVPSVTSRGQTGCTGLVGGGSGTGPGSFVAVLSGVTGTTLEARVSSGSAVKLGGWVQAIGRLQGQTIATTALTSWTPPAEFRRQLDCPAPAGGWSLPTKAQVRAVVDYMGSHSNRFAGLISVPLPGGSASVLADGGGVLVVGTTGPVAQATQALDQLAPDAVCVIATPYSADQLQSADVAVQKIMLANQSTRSTLMGGLLTSSDKMMLGWQLVRIAPATAQALAPYANMISWDIRLVPASAPESWSMNR
jgi:hypothetical protein